MSLKMVGEKLSFQRTDMFLVSLILNMAFHTLCASAISCSSTPDGSDSCGVHINEIYLHNGAVRVELFYEGRTSYVPRDYYILGHSGNTIEPPHYIHRVNCTFDQNGFCSVILGGTHVQTNKFTQAGPNVVALYKADDLANQFCGVTSDSPLSFPPSCGLEAIIFSNNPSVDMSSLTQVFSRNSKVVNSSSLFADDFSIQRCLKLDSQSPQYDLVIQKNTPTSFNKCPLPNVTINELDVDGQFVELRGIPGTLLMQTVLVLYSGHFNTSYKTMNLNGSVINQNGFFVIGSETDKVKPDLTVQSLTWLQGGASAVAIYQGLPVEFTESHSPISGDPRLIDAIVYGKSSDSVATTLLSALLKGQHQIDESGSSVESISRCGDGGCRLDVSTFGLASPTPGSTNANNCRIISNHKQKSLAAQQDMVRLNEIDAHEVRNSWDEFIELFDQGQGNIELTNMTVVFFNTQSNLSYEAYDLTGKKTNADGFFTIGTTSDCDLYVAPRYRYFLAKHLITLYKTKVKTNEKLSQDFLLDAVLYKTVGERDQTELLNSLLIPSGQRELIVRPTGYPDYTSISRCYSSLPRLNTAFSITRIATLGKPNHCKLIPVVINEINIGSTDENSNEFVELSSLGVPFFPLDHIVEVHYSGQSNLNNIYWTKGFKGCKTDTNGFFVVGSNKAANVSLTVDDKDFVKNGPHAVALYFGSEEEEYYYLGVRVHNHNLVDAICYGTGVLGGQVSQSVLETLTPGRNQVTEHAVHTHGDESINRCDQHNSVQYILGPLSASMENVCNLTQATVRPPVASLPGLVINEVNSDSPNGEGEDFIELRSPNTRNMSLDGYTLVFYDGADTFCYLVYDLTGKRTNSDGYFVIGAPGVPNADIVISDDMVQNGPDAVVLYYAPASWFKKGVTQATSENAVDAVVYGKISHFDGDNLVNLLLPNQMILNEDDMYVLAEDRSISRCLSSKVMSNREFYISPKTPGHSNNCTRPLVLINEVNAHAAERDTADFIELYDGGHGYTYLTGLTVVLFNGKEGTSYLAFDLTGYRTNKDGYFLIGSRDYAQNSSVLHTKSASVDFLLDGPDAIAVFTAHADEFPNGSPAHPIDMVDALIYNTGNTSSVLLQQRLLPGQHTVKEDSRFLLGDESMGRCCCGARQLAAFKLGKPSPWKPNDCVSFTTPYPLHVETRPADKLPSTPYTPPIHLPDVWINEVDCDQPGPDTHEFIELKGAPGTPLDGYVIALYNGRNEQLYHAINLDHHKINQNGLFVIGSVNIKHDFTFSPMGLLQNGVDAVALVDGRGRSFNHYQLFDNAGLKDAIVYTKYVADSGAEGFFEKAMVDDRIIVEEQGFLSKGEESINRCLCDNFRTSKCFLLSPPSPGEENACPDPALATVFQIRLTNADCQLWKNYGKDNQTKLFILKETISLAINKGCECGFSVDYISNFRIVNCGSITFQGEFMAVNNAQKRSVSKHFSHFVNTTSTIRIETETFTVDKECHMCFDESNTTHPNIGMVVGVTITCAIATGVIIFIIIYVAKKRRDGALHFRLKILEEEDDFIGDAPNQRGGTSSSSFANPVYSKLTNIL